MGQIPPRPARYVSRLLGRQQPPWPSRVGRRKRLMTFDNTDEDTRRRLIEEASHVYHQRPSISEVPEITTGQSQQMHLPSADAIDEAAAMIFEVLQLNAGAKQ